MNTMREWAKDNGFEVGTRGRLPKSLVVEYLMNHPSEARAFVKSKGIYVGQRGRISASTVYKAVSR